MSCGRARDGLKRSWSCWACWRLRSQVLRGWSERAAKVRKLLGAGAEGAAGKVRDLDVQRDLVRAMRWMRIRPGR